MAVASFPVPCGVATGGAPEYSVPVLTYHDLFRGTVAAAAMNEISTEILLHWQGATGVESV